MSRKTKILIGVVFLLIVVTQQNMQRTTTFKPEIADKAMVNKTLSVDDLEYSKKIIEENTLPKEETKIIEENTLPKIVDKGQNYKIEKTQLDEFEVTIFKHEQILYKDTFFRMQPHINVLKNGELIQIFVSSGSGSNYSIFVDITRNRISESLEICNPAFIYEDMVLSVEKDENDTYVVFKNIFDNTDTQKRYILEDAADFQVKTDIVQEAKVFDEESIIVKYYDKNYEVKMKIIKMN